MIIRFSFVIFLLIPNEIDFRTGCNGVKEFTGKVDELESCGNVRIKFSFVYRVLTEACSHGRAHKFYAESINSQKGFYGYACDSFALFIQGKCPSKKMIMGDQVN